MALPVRPAVWPPAPADVRPGRNDARLAAQEAFFEAALAGQPAAAAKVAAPQESPRASAAQAVRAAGKVEADTAAAQLPRPGSIVDIWV